MQYRDLELVRGVIDKATGLSVSYAYDDLVFPDYTAFIIQFDDDKPSNYYCHFHEDCDETKKLFGSLSDAFKELKCSLTLKGKFKLEQKKEGVNLEFI